MSQRLRALVADDEPLARARLLRLLAQFHDIEVVADCASGEEAIEQMHARQPDVVFLDIQMPGLDGFDVIDSLPRERRPGVVFVTAFSEHAVRAFEARALDYLLKPVSAIACAKPSNACASTPLRRRLHPVPIHRAWP